MEQFSSPSETSMNVHDRFASNIDERLHTWSELINDSDLPDELRSRLKETLSAFKEGTVLKEPHTLLPEERTRMRWQNVEDATYATIRCLDEGLRKASNQEEARALFENLKTDIWDFYREVSKD